jgi:hypothetical protein
MRQARLARPAHIPINAIGKSSGSPGEVVHYMHMMNVSYAWRIVLAGDATGRPWTR